jgi:hypothetical protein
MILAEIEKNPMEKIMISISEFKKKKYVDVRVYFMDDDMEWKPTKKGVTIAPDLIDQVIEALNKAKEEFEK